MSKQGRFLSLVLRHKPEEAGLTLDPEGWAPVRDVIKAVSDRYGKFTRADLDALVSENDKQRFIIEGDKIRANQGHSIDVDLKLEAKQPPPALYHGTKTAYLNSIADKGLVKGKRQHVHLSPDTDTALIVGRRRQGATVILMIDTTRVDQLFYQSANGVWLVDAVPPSAIKEYLYVD